MKVGYARVSDKEQNEARQIKAFKDMGVDKIYLDKQSGKEASTRKELRAMLDYIREGDEVIVESISRIARNTRDLLAIVEEINSKGAQFISLKEAIDTSTPTGQFMLTVFGAMAQLERDYILMRQAEGIEIAKQDKSKYQGKPKMAIDEEAMTRECKKWRDGKQTATATMEKLGLKPNTFYRRVKEMGL